MVEAVIRRHGGYVGLDTIAAIKAMHRSGFTLSEAKVQIERLIEPQRTQIVVGIADDEFDTLASELFKVGLTVTRK